MTWQVELHHAAEGPGLDNAMTIFRCNRCWESLEFVRVTILVL